MSDNSAEDKPPFHWRFLAGRQVRFCGGVRSFDDSGRDTFAAKDQNGTQHYGEFIKRWHNDQTTYDVVVKSFGYWSIYSVGIPAPGARATFTRSEANSMRKAVSALFSVEGERPYPLNGSTPPFSGRVVFEHHWIRLSPTRVWGLTVRQLLALLVIMLFIAAVMWWSVDYLLVHIPWLKVTPH